MEDSFLLDRQRFIFGTIFLLANKLQTIGDKYLAEGDITVRQWFLTIMIIQFKGKAPTLGEVAELMGTSHQNVKQLAIKLKEKGFLSFEKDEKDGRALRLKLTEKCLEFWKEREEKDNGFIVELFKELGEEEIVAMCSGFNKLLEKIEKFNI